MSFLQELRDRKRSLKHIDTVVTRADGTRYLERRHSSSSNGDMIPQPPTLGFVVDTAPDDQPALVLPHLYIGSQDCCTPDVLRRYNIVSVLSVGVPAPHATPSGPVAYTYVPCLDLPDTDLTHVFYQCNNVIRRALNQGVNVLVHCNAGVSRSTAVVIGYLILETHLSYDAAHQLVKSARPCVQPNAGFVQQLRNL